MPNEWPPAATEAVSEFASGAGRRSLHFAWLDNPENKPLRLQAEKSMPVASLVKPLIVDAIVSKVSLAELDNTFISSSELHDTAYPSILTAFTPERRLSLSEVCAFTLLTSDNSCANYLMSHFGLETVQQHGQRLGLKMTHVGATFEDEQLGVVGRRNTSSADDLAITFNHLFQRRHDSPRVWHWLLNSVRNNRIPGQLPDEVPVANKTGTLSGVACDAGVILGKRPLLAVVLTDAQADTAITTLEISRMVRVITEAAGIV